MHARKKKMFFFFIDHAYAGELRAKFSAAGSKSNTETVRDSYTNDLIQLPYTFKQQSARVRHVAKIELMVGHSLQAFTASACHGWSSFGRYACI
jgi:hypothetical protein